MTPEDLKKLSKEQKNGMRMARKAALEAGVPPELFGAIILKESGGIHPKDYSSGAIGSAQVRKAAIRDVNKALGKELDPHDPYQNMLIGAHLLKQKLNEFDGDPEKATLAYRWGAKAVKEGRIPTTDPNYTKDIDALIGGFQPYEGYSSKEQGEKIRAKGFAGLDLPSQMMILDTHNGPTKSDSDRVEAAATGAAIGAGTSIGLRRLGFDQPPRGTTSGRATQVAGELERLRAKAAEPLPESGGRTPYNEAMEGNITPDERKTTSGQARRAVFNRNVADEAREARGLKQLSEFDGRRIAGATDTGIAIPGTLMEELKAEKARAARTDKLLADNQAISNKERELAGAIRSDTPSTLARAGHALGHWLPQGLGGVGTVMSADKAMKLWEAGDRSQAVVNALEAAFGAVSMVPHPVARVVGGIGEAGMGGIDYLMDKYKEPKPVEESALGGMQ
jgi:hypothetical protein